MECILSFKMSFTNLARCILFYAIQINEYIRYSDLRLAILKGEEKIKFLNKLFQICRI